jgi:hypothetical protein
MPGVRAARMHGLCREDRPHLKKENSMKLQKYMTPFQWDAYHKNLPTGEK